MIHIFSQTHATGGALLSHIDSRTRYPQDPDQCNTDPASDQYPENDISTLDRPSRPWDIIPLIGRTSNHHQIYYATKCLCPKDI